MRKISYSLHIILAPLFLVLIVCGFLQSGIEQLFQTDAGFDFSGTWNILSGVIIGAYIASFLIIKPPYFSTRSFIVIHIVPGFYLLALILYSILAQAPYQMQYPVILLAAYVFKLAFYLYSNKGQAIDTTEFLLERIAKE